GGQNFKFYMMPIPFPYHTGMRRSHPMVAVGLILSDRLQGQIMALPCPGLDAFGLTWLGISFAAWSLFKFTFLRRTDRVPRRSPSYFFLTILATTILLCVLSIQLLYIFEKSDIDKNLRNLSEAIDKNLSGELQRSLRVMDSMNASTKFRDTIK